jgi:antitoxin CptB
LFNPHWNDMDRETRLKRLRFRAWHRGTKEADFLIGGFFDTLSAGWDEAAIAWFESLLDEEDVEIMAWAIGTATPPARYAGAMMERMQMLDYITVPK